MRLGSVNMQASENDRVPQVESNSFIALCRAVVWILS